MRLRIHQLDPGLALLPLRLFLGVTFVYGGIQKLADPGFFHQGAPTYIGTQLTGFAAGTPGGWLLRTFAIPHAQLAGAGVALLEIVIGLLVVAGLLTRWAALAGLLLNLVLFLTASWKTYPYFLGSDIVFVFAWLPFVLAGAAGQPAVDNELARRARPSRRAPAGAPQVSRRVLLGRALGATGVAALGIAGVATLLRGDYRGGATTSTLADTGAAPARRRTATRRHAHSHAKPSKPAGGVAIASSSALLRGHAGTYKDPGDGNADLVIRQQNGDLTAMSAICTHAGCACLYQNGQVQCPCHGSIFDAKTGAVVQGPANAPLPLRKVVEQGGKIYALPA
jgi:thiosulfate dehydrogenase [quinone] large subunit